MAILSTDIKYRLSGGASNSTASASLGGAMSTTTDAPASLWDDTGSAEAAAGRVEYRCIYVLNNNGTDSGTNGKIWIQANTNSADDTLDIGIGTAAISGTEQTVANETTAPTGVTFSSAANEGAALAIGTLTAGQSRSVWIRRTTTAGAAATASNTYTLRSKFDTV